MKSTHRFAIFGSIALLGIGMPRVTHATTVTNFYVVPDNPGALHPYTNWTTAAAFIQDAVDAAHLEATIWLGEGRHVAPPSPTNHQGPNVVYLNQALTLRGATGDPDDVMIDGEGENRLIAINHPSGARTYGFQGLTLTNGFTLENGGAILFSGSQWSWYADILDCVITHNQSANTGNDNGGGALYGLWPTGWFSPFISNTVFRSNHAASWGGAMLFRITSSTLPIEIVDSRFEHNTADSRSSAIYIRAHAGLEITRSIFRDNSGVVYSHQSSGRFEMRNSLVVGHDTTALHFWDGGNKVIRNSTIVNNDGSGLYASGNARLTLINSIVYDNAPNVGFAADSNRDASLFLHNVITPTNDLPGAGNLTHAPLFANPAAGDYRLRPDSPGVNAGTNELWMAETTDLAGNPRIDGLFEQVDVGAYELHYRGTTIFVR